MNASLRHIATRWSSPGCRECWRGTDGQRREALAAAAELVLALEGWPPSEPVLLKLFASAFFGTPLAPTLAAAHCDTIIVTGASTSGCVRARAVDCVQDGYRVVVPLEAVADWAAGPHEASLFDINATYCHVISTDETLELLGSAMFAEGTAVGDR